MLKGKKIILGVTGSIAAYKAAVLLRLLVKEGADVRVLMTDLAKEFVSPLTFATLSKYPVLSSFYNTENGDWNSHVDLGLWADIFIVAPATANTIAKMAHGIADNLLLTTYLSARCPVVIVPAMDLDMFLHATTQKNLEILRTYGNAVIEPASGELASGLTGKGRMEEPEVILEQIKSFFQKKKLRGKKILITAGPTHEHIDPVRYIGNNSSGKMGYALAESLAEQGADVLLVSGPVNLKTNGKSIQCIRVVSAKEMYDRCVELFPSCHAAILCAAVADYTPTEFAGNKLKRTGDLTLHLMPTNDIARKLGEMKNNTQRLAGFALETNNELEHAKEKLVKKNLDFIVLNSLNDEGAGFESDTNKITIIDRSGEIQAFPLKPKTRVASDIVNKLITFIQPDK